MKSVAKMQHIFNLRISYWRHNTSSYKEFSTNALIDVFHPYNNSYANMNKTHNIIHKKATLKVALALFLSEQKLTF